MGPFGQNAEQYWQAGLSVLPLKPRTKRPHLSGWERYCTEKPDDNTKMEWLRDYADYNIGLALGSEFRGMQIIAIDVDDEEVVDRVIAAVGRGPMKRGAKGMTILALADKSVTNTKIKRKLEGAKVQKPAVEVLANGSQTVIPPSVHPDGPEYQWITRRDLLSSLDQLPVVTAATIDEIRAFCQDKANPIQELNDMVWAGVNGGGNTHDVCVAAVACMVSRGWTDAEIHDRVVRAKTEACERSGDTYNWPHATKSIQEWIDSARAKGMTDSSKKGKDKTPPERVMCNWAADQLGRIVCFRGQLRQYRDGVWAEVDIDELKKNMYIQDPNLTEYQAKSAVSILHTMVSVKRFGETEGLLPKNDPKKQRVCLVNGTLNLRTGELERHAPDHELTHKLDFEWNEEATCPVYDRVMHETFRGPEAEKKEALWDEWCGLSLIDDMSFQKFLFLIGRGGNGKGTLVRVLEMMHDRSALGSVSITDLNDERKRTSLVGKLLNISSEESRMGTVADAYLKKITGEDAVDIRKLYGETVNNVKLSVRFLELVNEMPSTNDTTEAMRRRMIILECKNPVADQDTKLQDKLEAERSGILKRWVKALHRLYERGHFEEPDTSKQAVDDYLTENDTVKCWVRECCEPHGDTTPSRELYSHYKEWVDVMGFKPYQMMNEIVWGRRLVALGFPVEVSRIGKMTIRCRRLKIKDGQGF